MELTQTELKRLLHYDPDTGDFTWRVKIGKKVVVGRVAGHISTWGKGVCTIRLRKKLYFSHRLAWLYTYGHMPPAGVDHINGNPLDNRLANLRLATQRENLQNVRKPFAHGSSGFLGVTFCPSQKFWVANITKDQKTRYLGSFATAEEAHQAYLTAKRDMHPFGMI